jgi:hypothetical protein
MGVFTGATASIYKSSRKEDTMTLPAINVDALLSDALRSFEGPGVWSPPCNAYEDEHGAKNEVIISSLDHTAYSSPSLRP